MEIELTTVVAAILQVCVNERRSFTPSSVRKMIQHLDGAAARMDATLISARMQPHLKTLWRCGCIEFVPSVQLRNKPRRITDRSRLQMLIDDPSKVELWSSALIDAEPESGRLVEDEQVLEGTELQHSAEDIRDVRRELLEALEEHENDLQEIMSVGHQNLLDKLVAIEQQLSSLHELLDPTHHRLKEDHQRGNDKTVRTSIAPEPQTLAPGRIAPLAECVANLDPSVAELTMAEDLPQWLKVWEPTRDISMRNFFESRVVFYPGSGTDDQPVEFFGTRHAAHCFVYVDYGITKAQVLHELGDTGHPFEGYSSAGRTELREHDLTPNGWVPNIEPGAATLHGLPSGRPYAFVAILERQPSFDAAHGPQRLALLILCADGVAAYDSLFCQAKGTAPFAVVLQDHGYGGSWTRFGQGGSLEQLALTTGRLPQFLLVAANTDAWVGYSAIDGAALGGGGMHGFERQLWRRADLVGDASIAPQPLNAAVREESSAAFVDQPPQETSTQNSGPVLDDGPRLSASACFFRSIENSAAASELVARVGTICEELNVRVHHTYKNGGDLRVEADRPGPVQRRQNVFTMIWRPQSAHFHCEALLPTEECVDQGLPVARVGPNRSHPLPSRLFVTPPTDNEALLSIVALSIRRFREQ
jgi:hypothetical protein